MRVRVVPGSLSARLPRCKLPAERTPLPLCLCCAHSFFHYISDNNFSDDSISHNSFSHCISHNSSDECRCLHGCAYG